ncbi:DUF6318 family protein [Solicola gregarius]|uniref:DUF6318 family protein n=1 Tax=Solicola gregarius TaxID=2908642 RepID=A0AA46YJK0_9ACTN|nr:DUF6318 family protein [Solicola gregarius]UYM04650.1 DUF6318 family protein [Solicola gregarius]
MAGRRFLALIALLGCVLAGCSDAESDDDPAPLPTETPTSDVGERAVEVPVPPDAARKDTLKGAEAFIRHYIELLNYASDTGDTVALTTAAMDCSGCSKYEALFHRTYANGGFMKSAGWTPTYVLAVKQHDVVAVLVDVAAGRMRYRLSESEDPKIGRKDNFKLRFEVSRVGERWVVTDLGVQSIDEVR